LVDTPVAKRGFIPWRQIEVAVRAAWSIWLATTRPDGRPHAVQVWFVWMNTPVDFTSDRRRQNARNLAEPSLPAVRRAV
jgi:hypothetical protein